MVSLPSISLKGLTGHWTKYGGNVHDVFESQGEEFINWFCQSCNRELGREMQPYFYEYPTKEYVRVCAVCISDDCIILKRRVIFVQDNVIT